MIESLRHPPSVIASLILAAGIASVTTGDALLLLQEPPAPAETGDPTIESPTDSGFSSGRMEGIRWLRPRILNGPLGRRIRLRRSWLRRVQGRIRGRLRIEREFGLAWGGDWYDFDGTSELSPTPDSAPWSDVQAISLNGRVTSKGIFGLTDSRWSATVGLDLRAAGEHRARPGDSLTFGGLAAVSYAFNRRLSLGAGALVSTQIEDSILIIPALVVYWQVTDTVLISNVLGPEVYPTGAGIEAAWRPDATRELAIGTRYESRRFRLDDDGPIARRNGVGEDTGFPLWARATWRLENGIRLDLVGGVSLFNTYRLDDSNGNQLAETDLDPAPFIAAFMSWKF